MALSITCWLSVSILEDPTYRRDTLDRNSMVSALDGASGGRDERRGVEEEGSIVGLELIGE